MFMVKLLAITPPSLLSIFAGGLTTLAFAPFHLFLIPFFTFALLLHLWRKNTKEKAFIYGYLYGLGLFGVGVSWLHISINLFGGVDLIGAYALTFLLIAYLSLFPAVVGYLSNFRLIKSDHYYFLLTVPSLWTLGEWARSWLFTGFPWLSLGYTQTESALAGYAALFGVFGVTFFIAFLSGLLLLLLSSPDKKLLSSMGIIIVFAFAWLSKQHQWTEYRHKDIQVALIQGAIPQEIKWMPEYKQSSLEQYLTLTGHFWGHDLIIWPETAIASYMHNEKDFLDRLDTTAKEQESIILVGLPTKNLEDNEYFNSLLLLGETRQVYNKRHLVPFGEYVPLKPILNDLIKLMQIPMSDFSHGDWDKRPVFNSSQFSMGLSICYEDTFGNEIIQALPEADLLVNISNDAWFGDSTSPHQHLQMAQMRAIETGRFLVRATNTGVSAIIDEKGKIIGKTAQFEPDAVAAKVSLFTGATLYALTGNTPVVLSSFFFLFFVYRLKSVASVAENT